MYAVVEIAGQQFRVNPSEKLYVPKLDGAVDSIVKFDKVLLVADDTKITVGNPVVKGSTVSAKVLGHMKDDKVIVFKKKKRKGYRVKRGHRQQYTRIEITSIN
ncbi:MAG: 50S ribosomal protein L21 [Bacteroidetes bacterium]|jgi:large subunit ribosomal protein L21|nr:MAG: 50S ribosomal protein L21 [Bacteroidota bacterium]